MNVPKPIVTIHAMFFDNEDINLVHVFQIQQEKEKYIYEYSTNYLNADNTISTNKQGFYDDLHDAVNGVLTYLTTIAKDNGFLSVTSGFHTNKITNELKEGRTLIGIEFNRPSKDLIPKQHLANHCDFCLDFNDLLKKRPSTFG